MSKTPEEMAEEHANIRCPEQGPEFIVWCMCRDDFLAGYQAAKPHWISVKERLPEEGLEVLIFGKILNDFSKVLGVRARFQGDQSWKYTWESEDIHIYTQDDVTHWMPLPEAPKGER